MRIKKIGMNVVIPIMLFLSIVVSWKAEAITTGSVELTKWDSLIISNKTVLFFIILMVIAGCGGYLSSKFSKKRKILILTGTYTLVFVTGYVMSLTQPFRF